MFRSSVFALVGVLLFVCFPPDQKCSQEQVRVPKADNLEGLYELVSESVALTRPNKSTSVRASDEWEGLWQFCDGRYYNVMKTKSIRLEDYRFGSSTGSYKVQGDEVLLLMPEITQELLNPLSVKMGYRFDGDMLILTKTIEPTNHVSGEGTVTTVLRRRK